MKKYFLYLLISMLYATQMFAVMQMQEFNGNGNIHIGKGVIKTKNFNFTGTITCDEECTIVSEKPISYYQHNFQFTKKGKGKFKYVVQPFDQPYVPAEYQDEPEKNNKKLKDCARYTIGAGSFLLGIYLLKVYKEDKLEAYNKMVDAFANSLATEEEKKAFIKNASNFWNIYKPKNINDFMYLSACYVALSGSGCAWLI